MLWAPCLSFLSCNSDKNDIPQGLYYGNDDCFYLVLLDSVSEQYKRIDFSLNKFNTSTCSEIDSNNYVIAKVWNEDSKQWSSIEEFQDNFIPISTATK
jgi:hypothetical protein